MKKKSGAQVALVLGVVIVLLGVILLAVGCNQFANMETASSDFSSSYEYASSYSFGADFYTEMYGVTYDASTTAYLQMLTEVNAAAAALSDAVVEIVCGLPMYLKGDIPCMR